MEDGVSTSPKISQSIKEKQKKLYEMSHDYLIDNFHKFTEVNKIKVSLAIVIKHIPEKHEGSLNVTQMPVVKFGETPIDYIIGEQNAST